MRVSTQATAIGFVSLLSVLAACSSNRTVYVTHGTDADGGDGTGASGTNADGTSDNSDGTSDNGTSVPKTVTSKLAPDVTISEVAVFQAVKSTIAKAQKVATPGVPLVAARSALVRAYVTPASGFNSRSLKAVLSLVDKDGKALKAVTDTKTISSASSEASLDSTFNFEVPGDALPLGVTYSVAVVDESADPVADGTDSPARFPTDGTTTDLPVQAAGSSVKIVIVPVKYTADGSGRLPDTSASQLALDHDEAWSMYPVPEIDISVRSQPFTWSTAVKGSGQGWSELLQALSDLREQDGVADDVYYWGAFAAAASEQAFCGNGCVAGLSSVVTDPSDAYFRASIGVGYHGETSAETMAHEIGHAHGRSHSPCSDFGSIDGVDPNYPHQNAVLGAWGYDMINKVLIEPSSARDFMAYCTPTWVSDYTYQGLFQRISTLNKGKPLPATTGTTGSSSSNSGALPAGAGAVPSSFQVVTIGADGPASFGKEVKIRRAPTAEPREVQLLDATGKVIATVKGIFSAFDHLPGGTLLVPNTGVTYAGIHVVGFARNLMR